MKRIPAIIAAAAIALCGLTAYGQNWYATDSASSTEVTASGGCTQMRVPQVESRLEHRVVWTDKIGYVKYRQSDRATKQVEASISLENMLLAGWECGEWNVELVVHPDVEVVGGTTTRTALLREDVARFTIKLPKHDCRQETSCTEHNRNSYHGYRAWFIVDVVYNNNRDVPINSRVFSYPIELFSNRDF